VLHDHATTPFPFEIDAAVDVFETVEDFILSKFKSRSYKFMNNDIRESIDKIAVLFKKQPWELCKSLLWEFVLH
jgi:hypothetical protein